MVNFNEVVSKDWQAVGNAISTAPVEVDGVVLIGPLPVLIAPSAECAQHIVTLHNQWVDKVVGQMLEMSLRGDDE